MGTIAITGAASGIGLATRGRLEKEGHTVIGIDIRDTEVLADLSTEGGRRVVVRAVDELSGGVLDGLVVAAGVRGDDGAPVVSVNYFGAVATLEGLRPLLERGENPSAVAIASNSASTQPGYPIEIAEWCLANDEPRARQAAAGDGVGAYPASKLALALWVRRNATRQAWAGHGIRLNAIAPGFVDTPMTEGMWEYMGTLGEIYPIPLHRPSTTDEVASLLVYLLSPDAGSFCGSVVVMDGGTEAALRPDDWPRPIGI